MTYLRSLIIGEKEMTCDPSGLEVGKLLNNHVKEKGASVSHGKY